MAQYYPFGGQTYFLGSSIGSTDTTILLSSFLEPVTNTPYTMALINSTIVFATISPKTTSSEFISFTGITQNANGTATLTGVTRGLAKKYPFTSDTAYKLPHAGQSTFIISDAPQVFEQFSTLGNVETITGIKTFATGATPLITDAPTTPLMAVNKAYADALAIAGAPNASTVIQGLVQEATVAQINAGTATGSTGAKLFASPADLLSSNYGLFLPTTTQKDALAGTGTPSGSNKYVTADTDALKQLLSNLDTTVTLGTSNTLYPSQLAVKTYVDTGFVKSISSTTFETTGRFGSLAHSGTNTFDSSGCTMDTTVTTTRNAGIQWTLNNGGNNDVFAGNPTFAVSFNINIKGTTGSSFFGIGAVTVAGTGHTYTTKHAGFKIIITGSVASLYATQGDGSTETASSALATIVVNDSLDLFLRVNSGSSVDYYWNKNGTGWSTKTNLTTNMPTALNSATVNFSIANDSTATQNSVVLSGASYQR